MSVLINASTSTGLVQSADTSGEIELQSNGTTALKVNTNEGIQILNCLGVGNATPSTSGAGITFPATQSASSDANTLDDYEEGTWTPSLGGNTTYLAQEGRYVKIGRQVTVSFNLQINQIGTGSANLISGLPFTSANDTGYGGGVGYWSQAVNSFVYLALYTQNNTSLNTYGAGAASITLSLSNVFKNSTQLQSVFTYFV